MVFKTIGRARRVNVLLSYAKFAGIARLEAFSFGPFAALSAAVRLERDGGQGVRLFNGPLRQA